MQIKPQSILVTGGAGFIGSSFVRLSLERGAKVVVLDALTYAGHPENISNLGPKMTLVEGDIRDAALVSKLLREHKIDSIVHFAAESHVDRSIEDPTDFVQTNVVGTYALLKESYRYYKDLAQDQKSQFRYLQVSTDEVFGSLGETGFFTEKSPIEPNSPYSASKAGADQLVRAWFHTYKFPTVTTHCSNNYGPRQFPEKLIPRMIQCALKGEKLPVYGKGANIRDWIHVEDHCEGIWLALTKGDLGGVYCFGGRAERNNLDVVKTICSILDELRPRAQGKKYEELVNFVTDRLGHDFRYAIDDSLAEKTLGFKRKYDFTRGLKDTVKWYLDHQAWCDTILNRK
jgi:dTDP-glucose 4,6-dehydratase